MGLLDGISYASRLADELGISFDEALEMWHAWQRQTVEEYETATAESNVIPFKAKH